MLVLGLVAAAVSVIDWVETITPMAPLPLPLSTRSTCVKFMCNIKITFGEIFLEAGCRDASGGSCWVLDGKNTLLHGEKLRTRGRSRQSGETPPWCKVSQCLGECLPKAFLRSASQRASRYGHCSSLPLSARVAQPVWCSGCATSSFEVDLVQGCGRIGYPTCWVPCGLQRFGVNQGCAGFEC